MGQSQSSKQQKQSKQVSNSVYVQKLQENNPKNTGMNQQTMQKPKQFAMKISLQKLTRKDQIQPRNVPEKSLVQSLKKSSIPQQILYYQDTGYKMRIIHKHNNFFAAFHTAYNNHGDIVLVPDDIWLMITQYLANYIDQNAEKLRNQFVEHEGQKQLTIYELAGSFEESLKLQKKWDYFFNQIIKQIAKNTKEGVVDALKCDFSTTTQVYQVLSTSIIMSSFKKYFNYTRVLTKCGINNVYFDGIREDWVKIQKKLKYLERYDVDGSLVKYITHVSVILDNFLNTFDGKPDVKWWNTIFTSEQVRGGSGMSSSPFVEGWILHFFGIYQQIQIEKIPVNIISVPIKLINQLTKTQKQLELLTNWVSVSKIDKYTYKPDIGMCIMVKSGKQIKDQMIDQLLQQ